MAWSLGSRKQRGEVFLNLVRGDSQYILVSPNFASFL